MKESVPLRQALLGFALAAVVVCTLPWLSGGQEPVALLIDAAAVLAASIMLWRAPQVRRLPLRWAPIWAAALGLWAVASLGWSVNRYQTVVWALVWGLAMVVFTLAYRVAEVPVMRKWFTWAYLAAVGGVVLFGDFVYVMSSYNRFTSSFYWANPAAAYLIPALMLLWCGIGVEHKYKFWSWWQPLLAGIIASSFWLAASRGATLVLLMLSVILIVSRWRSKAFWTQLLLSLGIAIIATIGINLLRHSAQSSLTVSNTGANLSGRLAEAARGDSTSLTDRANYLRAARDIWYDHPFAGAGAGTFATIHPEYQRRVISASSSAHNSYAQTFAELGLIGGLLLLLVVVTIAKGVAKSAWYDPAIMPYALGLAALLLHFGLDIDASYPAMVMLTAAMAGLSYGSWEVRRRKPTAWLPLLSLVLLVPAITAYQSETWANHASIMQDNGDFETARDWYARAHAGLVYDPDTVGAEGIEDYTLALIGQDRPVNLRLALDRAHMAERLDSRDGQHWYLEGKVLVLTKQLPEAAKAFAGAIERDSYNHPEYYQQLAQVQLAQSQVDAALATAQKGTAQYPDSVINNRNLDPNVARSVATLLQIQAAIESRRGDSAAAARDTARAKRLIEGAVDAKK